MEHDDLNVRWPIEVMTTAGDLRITVHIAPRERPGAASVIDAPADGGRPAAAVSDDLPMEPIGGGRRLGNLLFVTSLPRLQAQIGIEEASAIGDLVHDSGYTLLTSSASTAEEIADEVRASVARLSPDGIVIIGGYGVIPAFAVDSFPEGLVPSSLRGRDYVDQFWVWSDDPYVDLDRDLFPELPISRIVDGHHAGTCVAQLCSQPAPIRPMQAIRMHPRPFVDALLEPLSTEPPVVVSDPSSSATFDTAWLSSPFTYLMLHGYHQDGTRFRGEDAADNHIELLTVGALPDAVAGTFFTGCCYGALVTSRTAHAHHHGGDPISDRTETTSFATALLGRGAHAFVGCTGTHYSPRTTQATSYGAPFHAFFLEETRAGAPPAVALHRTKRRYFEEYLSQTDGYELAIGMKILRQYTCLGLGW